MNAETTTKWVRSIAGKGNSVSLEIPFENGYIDVHHSLDSKHDIHTHIAVYRSKDDDGKLRGFEHGFYRSPSG
jgi:hypothetical protein